MQLGPSPDVCCSFHIHLGVQRVGLTRFSSDYKLYMMSRESKVTRLRLLLSGDVELNPGPAIRGRRRLGNHL